MVKPDIYITDFINYAEKEKAYSVHTLKSYNHDLDRFYAFMTLYIGKSIWSYKEVDKQTIRHFLGREFEEGTYKNDDTSREINIYQFDNEKKLARILTHEFGHALGLKHLENPKAVMYRLNNGINEKLTIEDILALKKHCSLLTW